ncbi:MAG: flagellar hook-associated protein FlgK [Lachnospiraceae bacterium]|jgi:flagellar hook-associated protein 1 FlgK|nr:flagellar hook-associated protein FlgK [Lachnospiraceae bacterium]
MSLFGNLYVGAGALQTEQYALNTAAHNLSNVSTKGYTRQQVVLNDNRYFTLSTNTKSVANMQTGLGVTFAQIRTVRDFFLDQSYRKETGRSAFYETSYNVLTETETLLGELDGESFSKSLDNLYEALKELAKNPSSSVNQGLLVTRASEFIERSNSVYDALKNYQDNLNKQIKLGVKQINETSKRLKELNNAIVQIEASDVEHANDLRDERNLLLDKLGALGNIRYVEDNDGSVTVRLEGHLLCNREVANQIGLDEDEATEFYTPFWEGDAVKKVNPVTGEVKYDYSTATVYNLNQTISTAMDTDIGSVKAMLLARGDHRANYTDLVSSTSYTNEISNSVLMNVEAEFDNLIHNIVCEINAALKTASDKADAAAQNMSGDPDAQSDYMKDGVDPDGKKIPLQLFTRIAADKYEEEDISKGMEHTRYSLGNLVVNPELLKTPTLFGFINDLREEDFETADLLQKSLESENYTLNPSVTTKSSLIDYYSNIVSQVANTGAVFKSVYNSEQTTVNQIETARQQISGISDDEELENMIKFQNAYNAASRYITVVDEMIEHLVTALGR